MKVPSPKYYTQKYNVKPHEFRSIVQIMRKTEGVGEDNEPVPKLNQILKVRALVTNVSTEQKSDSKGEINIRRIRALFYYPRNTTVEYEDILVFEGLEYNITSVVNVQQANVFMEIEAYTVS